MSEPISSNYDHQSSPAGRPQDADAQSLQTTQAGFAALTSLDAGLPARERRWRISHPRHLIAPTLTALAVIGLLGLLLARILAAQHAVATPPPTQHPGDLSAAGPTIGSPAPDFTLTVWDPAPGATSTIHLTALAGHPVVVNFWAPWCAPCQQEAPLLAAAAHTYAARGVIFLGVAFDTHQQDAAAFLRRTGITYPCGPDTTGAIASAYALPGIPVTVFINRHGIIAQKIIGPLTAASLTAALVSVSS